MAVIQDGDIILVTVSDTWAILINGGRVDLGNLDTTNKDTLVLAMNELVARINDLDSSKSVVTPVSGHPLLFNLT